MIAKKVLISVSFLLLTINSVSAQPPREDNAELFNRLDENKNGTIERIEFTADADTIFKNFDRNNDGALDEIEVPKPPPGRRGDFPPPRGERSGNLPERPKLPPHFMMRDENRDGKVTRAEFDENLRRHYAVMDKNGDGVVTREEFDRMRETERHRQPPRPGDLPPTSPTVQFLGAEMRFGDKLIKDAPFSAETVLENTRRLYDGSTVTAQSKGAIYRDVSGRTRREQPLESVGAFSLGSESQKLIFITDAGEGTQYFLDQIRKTARRIPLSGDNRPQPTTEPGEGKTESLGKKILEGVAVEGTRTTIEISAGRVGNDKPLQIVTERWYSAELQTVVMTRHIDPLMGEQVFRLVNIRRGEPARELFLVPNDYKVESDRNPR
jgi:Ca2+-binding EF-hand superfamily protein